jgi:hypothetical protein
MRRVLAVLLLVSLGACSGDDGGTVDVPKGVTFRVEQARQDLQGRNFQLQVVNHGSRSITVSGVELTSRRLAKPSVYRGPATIPPGVTTNLTMAMSPARCARPGASGGIEAKAKVTYQVGDGKEVVSFVQPADHYGSVALFMKRDCAESTIGSLSVDDDLTVSGRGRDSVLKIGMTFVAKDTGGPVEIGPVDGTTLLRPTSADNIHHELAPGSGAYETVLEIMPNRCDVHVVAEDRTGATMPLHVDSEQSGKAFFFLRFTEHQKKQIFDFVARHCGFGVDQDPLNAP